jgi:hypothetical protein
MLNLKKEKSMENKEMILRRITNGLIGELGLVLTKEITLRRFSDELMNELGIDPIVDVKNVESERVMKNKLKKKNQFCEQHKFKCEDYRLVFIPFNDNTVELFTFKTYEYGKGKGTEVLNTILDVCDKMNINLKLDPFGFIEGKNNSAYDRWLKGWYKSFGFVEKPFDRFGALIYKSEQNLKMAA